MDESMEEDKSTTPEEPSPAKESVIEKKADDTEDKSEKEQQGEPAPQQSQTKNSADDEVETQGDKSDAGEGDLVMDISPQKEEGSKTETSPAKSVSSANSSPGASAKLRKRANVDPNWLLPFKEGWRRELVLRNTYDVDKGNRPCDVYYYPPNKGPKLRSGVQIVRYLDKIGCHTLTGDCFTFVKDQIHEDPEEFVRFAGKHTNIGRPKPSSPTKSPKTPKTPVMKQKKSPFVKSSLTLKKNAMGLATSPQSPKHSPIILKMGNRTLTPDTKTTIVKKDLNLSMTSSPQSSPMVSIIRSLDADTALPKTLTPVTLASGTHVLKIAPKVIDLKKPVAKKHTAPKRPVPSSEASVSKKAKLDMPGVVKLCGMDCPGRHGVPPSLHCTTCMCMFHPECVGRSGHQVIDGFVCKACKSLNTKTSDTPSVKVIRPLNPGPPPLQVSGAVSGSTVTIRTGGPPPLRAAPNIVTSNVRQPPPLRMAPQGVPTGLAIGPPPLRPSTGMRPIAPAPVIPLSVIEAGPSISKTNGIQAQPPPPLAPVAINLPAAPPIQTSNQPPIASLPPIAPKEVSGQILALPSNVTSQLNMDKPVALKVNGQRYIIPPHCFINTQEGAKIYLPPGYLPSNTMDGPAKPLSINLNTGGKDEQMLRIAPYSEQGESQKNGDKRKSPSPIVVDVDQIPDVAAAKETGKSKTRRRSRTQDKSNLCHIQQLHVGFDCMLYIFQNLSIKDILRAKLVCKTWKRVATQHCMWRKIQLRGCLVNDWEKACKVFREMHTQILDLRGLSHPKDTSRTWHQLTAALPHLVFLRRIDLGQCPSNLLHSITEKVTNLEEISAEFITDNETDMWSTNARLDIGKFSNLKDLEVLRLRGVCGLVLPAFSFSGGLTELCALSKLRMLSLTTLRDVAEDEFTFLTALSNLEELELGDLSSWKPETYSQLSSLENLRSLRLECGVDHKEGGLGEALQALNKLKNLELIKFAVSTSLVNNLSKVPSLKTLSIWPDTESKAAYVNTCTLRAVSNLKSLENLDWGIMIDTATLSSGNQDDEDSNSSCGGSSSAKKRDSIPILPTSSDLAESSDSSDEDIVEYLSIAQLVDRLSNHLDNTKIRVFKVPVISPKAKAAS